MCNIYIVGYKVNIQFSRVYSIFIDFNLHINFYILYSKIYIMVMGKNIMVQYIIFLIYKEYGTFCGKRLATAKRQNVHVMWTHFYNWYKNSINFLEKKCTSNKYFSGFICAARNCASSLDTITCAFSRSDIGSLESSYTVPEYRNILKGT